MALHIEGLAMSLLVVVLVFLIFSWMVVALRLGVRIWIKGVGYDDYFIISGLVSLIWFFSRWCWHGWSDDFKLLYTVCCISTTLAVYNGVGTHANRLNAYYEIEGKKVETRTVQLKYLVNDLLAAVVYYVSTFLCPRCHCHQVWYLSWSPTNRPSTPLPMANLYCHVFGHPFHDHWLLHYSGLV